MARVGKGISPPLDMSPTAEALSTGASVPLPSPAARPPSLLPRLSSPNLYEGFDSHRAGLVANTDRRRSTSRLLVSPQRSPPPPLPPYSPMSSRGFFDVPLEQRLRYAQAEREGEAQVECYRSSSMALGSGALSGRTNCRVMSPAPYRLIYVNGNDTETLRHLSLRKRSLTTTPPLMALTDRDAYEDEYLRLNTCDIVHSRPLSAAGRMSPASVQFSLPREDPRSSSSSSFLQAPFTVPRDVTVLPAGNTDACVSSRHTVYPIIGPNERWTSSDEEEKNKRHKSGGNMPRSGDDSVLESSRRRPVVPDTLEIMRSFHALQLRKELEVLMEYEVKGRGDVINSYLRESRELLIGHTFRLAMLRTSPADALPTSPIPKPTAMRVPGSAIPSALVRTEKKCSGSKKPLPVSGTSVSGTRPASHHDISSPISRDPICAAETPLESGQNVAPRVAEVLIPQLLTDELAARQCIRVAASNELHFFLRLHHLIEAALHPSALLLREANQRQSIAMAAAVALRRIQSTQSTASLLRCAQRLTALAGDEDHARFKKCVQAEARERRRLEKLFTDGHAALHEMELYEMRQRLRRVVEALAQEERIAREYIAVAELQNRGGLYRSGEAIVSMHAVEDISTIVAIDDPHTSATGSPERMHMDSTAPTALTTTVSMEQTKTMTKLPMGDMNLSGAASMRWAVADITTNTTNTSSMVGERVFFEWNPTSNTVTHITNTTTDTPIMSAGGKGCDIASGSAVLCSHRQDLSADNNDDVRSLGTPSPMPQAIDALMSPSIHKGRARISDDDDEEEEEGEYYDDDENEAYNEEYKQDQGQGIRLKMDVQNDDDDDDENNNDDFSRRGNRDPTHVSSHCELIDHDATNMTAGKKPLPTPKEKTPTHTKSPINQQRPLNRHVVPCSLQCKGTSPAKNTANDTVGWMPSLYTPAQQRTPSVKRPYHDDIIFDGGPLIRRDKEPVESCRSGEIGCDVVDDLSGPSSSSSASLANSPTHSAHRSHSAFREFKSDHEKETDDFESVEDVVSVQDYWDPTDHLDDGAGENSDHSPSEVRNTLMHVDDKKEQEQCGVRDSLRQKYPMAPGLPISSMHEATIVVSDVSAVHHQINCTQTHVNDNNNDNDADDGAGDANGSAHRSTRRLSPTTSRPPLNYMRPTMSWRRQHESLEWIPREYSRSAAVRSVSRKSSVTRMRVSRVPFEEGPGVWPELSEPRRPFDFDPLGDRAHRATTANLTNTNNNSCSRSRSRGRRRRRRSRSRSGSRSEEGLNDGHFGVNEAAAAMTTTTVQSARRARDAARRFMADGSVSPPHSSARKTTAYTDSAEVLEAALRGIVALRGAQQQQRQCGRSESAQRAATPSYVDAFFRLTPGEAERKGFLAALRGESSIRDATPLRIHHSLSGRDSKSKSKSGGGMANSAQRPGEAQADSTFIAQATRLSWSPQSKPWR